MLSVRSSLFVTTIAAGGLLAAVVVAYFRPIGPYQQRVQADSYHIETVEYGRPFVSRTITRTDREFAIEARALATTEDSYFTASLNLLVYTLPLFAVVVGANILTKYFKRPTPTTD